MTEIAANTDETAVVEAALSGHAPAQPPALPPIDGRSRLARTFRRTRADVVQSLGGPENISAQQALAVQQLAEAEALRACIFARATQGEAYDVGDYTALAAVGQRALKLLGLKRVARDVPGLQEYMRGKVTGGTSAG